MGGWEKHSNADNLRVMKREEQGGAPGHSRIMTMWRFQKTFRQTTVRRMANTLLDAESRTRWDKHVVNCHNLGKHDGTTVIQTVFDGLGPVKQREALEFRVSTTELSGADSADPNGDILIAFTSDGIAAAGLSDLSNTIRIHTTISGWAMKAGRVYGTVDFTMVSLNDPGGVIPDWIMRRAAAKGAFDFTHDLQVHLSSTEDHEGGE